MAHRKKQKRVVQMGDAKYGLYNFQFPKSFQPKDVQVESPTFHEVEPDVAQPVTVESNSKGDSMAQEHVERFLTDDGREAVKITRNKTDYHSNTKVVEVFEDKVTPHVLTKRITEYTKPVVYKIKTEMIDEHGNVVDVVIEELDENAEDFKMVERHEEVAPVVAAQSVPKPEPVVKHIKKSFADMRSLSLERNKSISTKHKVHRCDDCGGVIQE